MWSSPLAGPTKGKGNDKGKGPGKGGNGTGKGKGKGKGKAMHKKGTDKAAFYRVGM